MLYPLVSEVSIKKYQPQTILEVFLWTVPIYARCPYLSMELYGQFHSPWHTFDLQKIAKIG